MKSKYVIKHENFEKKMKMCKIFQKNMGNHKSIRKYIKNRKIEK